MQVFVVSETDYDHYRQHGIFTELEQAEAYVAMVEASEAQQEGIGLVWGALVIDTVELDALIGAIPLFATYSADGKADLYGYGRLPQPPVLPSIDDPSRLTLAFGRTPDEARANFRNWPA